MRTFIDNHRLLTAAIAVALGSALLITLGLLAGKTERTPATKSPAAPIDPTPTAGTTTSTAPGGPIESRVRSAALTDPGTVYRPGQTAVVIVPTRDGTDLYFNLVVSAPMQLDGTDADKIRAAAADTQPVVYTATATATFLGTGDGSAPQRHTADVLDHITIVSHPGSPPLTNRANLTTDSCRGLPTTLPKLTSGTVVTWCIAALAGGSPGSATPIGAQFVLDVGAYATPVFWIDPEADHDRIP